MAINRDKKQLMKKINDFLIQYFHWMQIFFVLLILLVGLFFIVLPKYQEASKTIDEALNDQQNKYLQATRSLSELKKVNSDYDSVGADIKSRIKQFLPDELKPEDIMAKLEFLATQQGVMINSIKISPGDEVKIQGRGGKAASSEDVEAANLSKDIARAKISINMSNVDYILLKSFLARLEKSLQLFDVENVSYDPSKASADLVIYSYYLKSEI